MQQCVKPFRTIIALDSTELELNDIRDTSLYRNGFQMVKSNLKCSKLLS